LGTCPWCALENKGVVYFIDIGLSFTTGASGFVLSKVWAAIEAIPSPSSASIPVVGSILVTPTPLPQGVSDSGQVFFLRFLIVGAAAGLIAAAPAIWWLIALGAWFSWGIAGESGEAERKIERDKRQVILNEAQREFESVEKRIRNEIGPEGFSLKKQELTDLRNEYQSLPAQEKNEIDRLHATAESRQKHRFLESCFIDSANIPGVALAKKSALRSFGIETAADVSRSRVQSVRGFGEVLTRAVVDWKKSCERRFIFNPYNAVSESDKNVIRAKIAARKRVIETSLIAGVSDLQRFRQEAGVKANILYPQINAAAKKLAQAQADLNLLRK
jgi:DNA-binding helix-hairpin-helix protein with protein kinase domain